MRAVSSPPSPTASAVAPRGIPSGDYASSQSNLEDSVKHLTLSARRRLVKRRSTGVIPPRMDSLGALGALQQKEAAGRPDTLRRSGRVPSCSKRHASLDSRRETPLPSPSLVQPQTLFPKTPSHTSSTSSYFPSVTQVTDSLVSDSFPWTSATDENVSAECNGTSGSLPNLGSPRETLSPHSSASQHSSESQTGPTTPNHMAESIEEIGNCSEISEQYQAVQNQGQRTPKPYPPIQSHATSLVLPLLRPNSMPQAIPGAITLPSHANPFWPDRTSSASLPLPMHTPFTALPSVPNPPLQGHPEQKHEQGADDSPTMDPVELASAAEFPTGSRLRLPSGSMQSYPPPAPPTILTPPATPPLCGGGGDTRPRLPYEPFLSNAPAPDDCWIAVETTSSTYILTVKLPGFKRDGITLATRRRRILHVVADSWEPGGGHFERRIAFGYDADLGQVRAEFDGEQLRISIPRRPPHTSNWFSDLNSVAQQ